MVNSINIWRIIYSLLLFCIVFEEMFSRMIGHLTLVKYVLLLFILLRINLCKKKVNIYIPKRMLIFGCLLTIYMLFSIIDFFSYDFNGFMLWKQYLFMPLFIYVFLHSEKICKLSSKTLITKFIRYEIIYSILDVLLYFVYIPIWNSYQTYWGRIGVGYATIDVVVMAFALILLWFYEQLKVCAFFKIVGGIILWGVLLCQSSGTGLFTLLIVFLFSIIYILGFKASKTNMIYVRKKSRIYILASFFVIAFLSYSTILWMQKNNNDMYLQLENRAATLLNVSEYSSINVNTMEVRQEQFDEAYKYLVHDNLLRDIFGCGYGRIKVVPNGNTNVFFLESLFYIHRIAIGWIGTFFFYGLLIWALVKAISKQSANIGIYVYIPFAIILFGATFTSGAILSTGIAGVIGLIVADYVNGISLKSS